MTTETNGLSRIQEILDENTKVIPEGLYIQLCDEIRKVYNKFGSGNDRENDRRMIVYLRERNRRRSEELDESPLGVMNTYLRRRNIEMTTRYEQDLDMWNESMREKDRRISQLEEQTRQLNTSINTYKERIKTYKLELGRSADKNAEYKKKIQELEDKQSNTQNEVALGSVVVKMSNQIKPTKQPTKPNAYITFCSENRAIVRAKNPGISFGDTAKELARLWNEKKK